MDGFSWTCECHHRNGSIFPLQTAPVQKINPLHQPALTAICTLSPAQTKVTHALIGLAKAKYHLSKNRVNISISLERHKYSILPDISWSKSCYRSAHGISAFCLFLFIFEFLNIKFKIEFANSKPGRRRRVGKVRVVTGGYTWYRDISVIWRCFGVNINIFFFIPGRTRQIRWKIANQRLQEMWLDILVDNIEYWPSALFITLIKTTKSETLNILTIVVTAPY